MKLTIFYLIFFGSLGVLSRFFLGIFIRKNFTVTFPFDTLSINIIGSFLIGFIYILSKEKIYISEPLRIALMIGFLGGFTTFSSFSLETIKLLEDKKIFSAAIYFIGSPLLTCLSVYIGIVISKTILK